MDEQCQFLNKRKGFEDLEANSFPTLPASKSCGLQLAVNRSPFHVSSGIPKGHELLLCSQQSRVRLVQESHNFPFLLLSLDDSRSPSFQTIFLELIAEHALIEAKQAGSL